MHVFVFTLFLAFSSTAAAAEKTAIFAGGCFWCMEAAFQDKTGVIDVVSGFTGGTLPNPTYKGNHEGHVEAVLVTYAPDIITYEKLLQIYWRNIDPFDGGGQFCDRGPSYRPAIFYTDAEQRELANGSKTGMIERFFEQQVLVPVREAMAFWPVEASHQDYYIKNPIRYQLYRKGCGRDARLEAVWGQAGY